jgi:hypothetical protein
MGRRSTQKGRGIGDVITKLLSPTGLMESPPEYEGEKHAKNYNFLGPGTDLEDRKRDRNLPSKPNDPINKLDSAAKKHDYAYKKSNEKLNDNIIDQKTFLKEVHQADDDFINELKEIPDISMTKIIASKAILLKKFAEKHGLLSPTEFSQSGSGFIEDVNAIIGISPDNQLRKERRFNQSGGFLPALVPFIAPIVASLATEGISKLIDHFTEKQKKQGQEGSGIKPTKRTKLIDNRKFVAHTLDNMPSNKQIELMYDVLVKK